jgi:glycosyltransferase involved in cell wall biosynthesis
VPVWASNVGGLPELIDDEVGGLFPPGDPESLARAVVRGIQGGKLKEKGEVARDRVVERWSNQRLARRHVEIYSDLLHKRG